MPKAFLYKMSECLSFALGIPNAYYLKPKALSEAQLTRMERSVMNNKHSAKSLWNRSNVQAVE